MRQLMKKIMSGHRGRPSIDPKAAPTRLLDQQIRLEQQYLSTSKRLAFPVFCMLVMIQVELGSCYKCSTQCFKQDRTNSAHLKQPRFESTRGHPREDIPMERPPMQLMTANLKYQPPNTKKDLINVEPDLQFEPRSLEQLQKHHRRKLALQQYHRQMLKQKQHVSHAADRHKLPIGAQPLPNGPPPFRPSPLMLSLNSFGALEKLKRTKIFKRMYKSRVYYLFMDVLQQLMVLLDNMAKKKVDLAETNVAAIQAVAHKLLLKSGQMLKLKWPLVMLNPHFIREILSNPTMLVMLFHAIEVAYMSLPVAFWLKPLVKLVKQPTPEKEEETWWRRKRIYDVMNGPGSSELQPNLKTIHFRHPGEPAPPISLAGFTDLVHQFTGSSSHAPHVRPEQHHYPAAHYPHTRQPPPQSTPVHQVIIQPETDHLETEYDSSMYPEMSNNQLEGHNQYQFNPRPVYHDHATGAPANHYIDQPSTMKHQEPETQQQQHNHQTPEGYMSSAQEESFLANQHPTAYGPIPGSPNHHHSMASDWSQASESKQISLRPPPVKLTHSPEADLTGVHHQTGGGDQPFAQMPDIRYWPNDGGDGVISPDQLMSQKDFQMLEPHERELVLRETRDRLIEARLADELIKQQSEFVDTIRERHDASGGHQSTALAHLNRYEHSNQEATTPTIIINNNRASSRRVELKKGFSHGQGEPSRPRRHANKIEHDL